MNKIKEDPKINKAFNELWLYHRNFYNNIHFFNYTVQGFLSKENEDKGYKLWNN